MKIKLGLAVLFAGCVMNAHADEHALTSLQPFVLPTGGTWTKAYCQHRCSGSSFSRSALRRGVQTTGKIDPHPRYQPLLKLGITSDGLWGAVELTQVPYSMCRWSAGQKKSCSVKVTKGGKTETFELENYLKSGIGEGVVDVSGFFKFVDGEGPITMVYMDERKRTTTIRFD